MNKVLFLTNAGDEIGFGHIIRCNALKSFLKRRGIDSQVILHLKGEINSFVEEEVQLLNWIEERDAIQVLAETCEILIVDSYIAPLEYYFFLKSLGKKVIAIDDYNRLPFPADVLINPNVSGEVINYTNQSARVFAGREFTILRTCFLEYRNRRRPCKRHIENLLITLGGSDFRNILPGILNVMTSDGFRINVIAGTQDYKERLSRLYKKENMAFFGFVNGNEMVSLMSDADVAISAAGQTLNELAYMGVPAIAICIDEDQKPNMTSFYNNGFLTEKMYWDDPLLLSRLKSVFSKMKKEDVRRKLSDKGQALIDGSGLEKIYEVLLT